MSRHDVENHMATPWRIEAKPDRPGGGYLIKGSGSGKVSVYGSRADAELIVAAVNAYEASNQSSDFQGDIISD